MIAGSGLTHAEFNMEGGPARAVQIWIEPDRRGAPPSWGRKTFARDACHGHFLTLASGIAGDEDALPIRSDARVLAVALCGGRGGHLSVRRRCTSRLSGRVQGAADRQ